LNKNQLSKTFLKILLLFFVFILLVKSLHPRVLVSIIFSCFVCSNKSCSNSFSANFDRFHASNDSKTSSSAINVDPFQTVDPFASQSDIGSPTTLTNNDWFQSSNNVTTTTNDPFLSKTDNSVKNKSSLSKKPSTLVDPWGSSTPNKNGNGWTPLNNGNSGTVQYRALYDYKPERNDEMAMSIGDVITVS